MEWVILLGSLVPIYGLLFWIGFQLGGLNQRMGSIEKHMEVLNQRVDVLNQRMGSIEKHMEVLSSEIKVIRSDVEVLRSGCPLLSRKEG